MNNLGPMTLARATHVPTRTRMVVVIRGEKDPVYLRDMGYACMIRGRHFMPPKLDLRFLSSQEEKRFNTMATSPSDWQDLAFFEGDDAYTEADDLYRHVADEAVKKALAALLR